MTTAVPPSGAGARPTVSATLRREHFRAQFAKTQLCTFFLKKRCTRGTRCEFAHGEAELQSPPEFQAMRRDSQRAARFMKTELCSFFEHGRCTKGSTCHFAHGAGELRSVPDLKKTSLCKMWLADACPYSEEECVYAHGTGDLRRTPAFAAAGTSSAGTPEVFEEEDSAPGEELFASGSVESLPEMHFRLPQRSRRSRPVCRPGPPPPASRPWAGRQPQPVPVGLAPSGPPQGLATPVPAPADAAAVGAAASPTQVPPPIEEPTRGTPESRRDLFIAQVLAPYRALLRGEEDIKTLLEKAMPARYDD